jgi:alkanesulfonate monooxygenase SsuD/methylene tetrahydromethanopterin reductase-like flavin-dependent oxidoreductase (luciferase family)
VDFGIMLGDHPTSVPAAEHFDGILRQVEAAQKAGVTHLLIGQHFLWPGGSRWLQPIPTLARLAGEVDESVRLATQIVIAPLYHPVMLAEELATLDIMTKGRLDVGLGLGYLPKEFEAFGIPFEERVTRFEEGIELMRAIWTQDKVDFHGDHYQVEDSTVHIRPVQDPHPPLWLGAQTKVGIRRAARLGDAWPITPQVSAADLPTRVKVFADERERLGKPFRRLPLRREIVVGRDRGDATARAIEMAQPWYLQMAAMGTKEVDPSEVVAQMHDIVARSFVLGSAAECAEQLRAMGDRTPINPVVTRGNWPGMSVRDMVEYIETLGEELIPSMRDYNSTPTLQLPEETAK